MRKRNFIKQMLIEEKNRLHIIKELDECNKRVIIDTNSNIRKNIELMNGYLPSKDEAIRGVVVNIKRLSRGK